MSKKQMRLCFDTLSVQNKTGVVLTPGVPNYEEYVKDLSYFGFTAPFIGTVVYPTYELLSNKNLNAYDLPSDLFYSFFSNDSNGNKSAIGRRPPRGLFEDQIDLTVCVLS